MNNIETLIGIMAALRNPDSGCPWDIEQDFASIAPYTIEEAYEVAEAIRTKDLPGLCDELGDLLLQVVFHARIAEEHGAFAFPDVVAAISNKLVRRHPHVFADEQVEGADQQRRAWEATKARERSLQGPRADVLGGVAMALPALLRAAKLGRRAAAVGFDWPDVAGVMAKVREELGELEACAPGDRQAATEEIGDLLFTLANLARHMDIDPEDALRLASRKFEERFQRVEEAVHTAGGEWEALSAEQLDAMWREAKRAVSPRPLSPPQQRQEPS